MSDKKLKLKNWYNLPTRTKVTINKLIAKVQGGCIDKGDLQRSMLDMNWHNTPTKIKRIIDEIEEASFPKILLKGTWSELPDDIDKLEALVDAFECEDAVYTEAPTVGTLRTKRKDHKSITLEWDKISNSHTLELGVETLIPNGLGTISLFDTFPLYWGQTEFKFDTFQGNPIEEKNYQFHLRAVNNVGQTSSPAYNDAPTTPPTIVPVLIWTWDDDEAMICDVYGSGGSIPRTEHQMYTKVYRVFNSLEVGDELYTDAEATIKANTNKNFAYVEEGRGYVFYDITVDSSAKVTTIGYAPC